MDWNSTQWRRSAWRKALNPSINKRTPTVREAQKAKTTYITIPPTMVPFPIVNPILMTMFHSTSLNCAWAKLRAHNRRYEAVCDILKARHREVFDIYINRICKLYVNKTSHILYLPSQTIFNCVDCLQNVMISAKKCSYIYWHESKFAMNDKECVCIV